MIELELFSGLKWILLYSDLLIFGTLILSIIALIRGLRKPLWRQLLLQIISHGKTVFCLGWLLVLILIALSDSIHYQSLLPDSKAGKNAQYGPTKSLLDHFCRRVQNNPEESYSGPMAIQSFTQVLIEKEDGVSPGYPRLSYGGSHLESSSDHKQDIALKSIIAIVIGLLASGILTFISLWLIKRIRHKLKLEGPLSKGSVLATTLFFLTVCLSASYLIFLSQYYHIFGTDRVGQSTLWTALKSIRTAFIIGSLTTFFLSVPAVILGMLAGYLRGWVDDVIQYVYTVISSIPNILLISAAMLIVQTQLADASSEKAADQRLLFLCLTLGLTGWAGLCRLIRAEVLKLRDISYVESARVMGLNRLAIMARHLLPNVMHIVLIEIILRFSQLILTEAVLAYIGIGVHPATQSFGNMIVNAQEQMARTPVIWWNLLTAFIFMLLLVVPTNIVGDAIRDALDPKLKMKK